MYRYLILALVLAGCAVPTSNFTRPAELYHPGEYPWSLVSDPGKSDRGPDACGRRDHKQPVGDK